MEGKKRKEIREKERLGSAGSNETFLVLHWRLPHHLQSQRKGKVALPHLEAGPLSAG